MPIWTMMKILQTMKLTNKRTGRGGCPALRRLLLLCVNLLPSGASFSLSPALGAVSFPAVPAEERSHPPFPFRLAEKETGRGRSKGKGRFPVEQGRPLAIQPGFLLLYAAFPERFLLLLPRVPLRYALLRR